MASFACSQAGKVGQREVGFDNELLQGVAVSEWLASKIGGDECGLGLFETACKCAGYEPTGVGIGQSAAQRVSERLAVHRCRSARGPAHPCSYRARTGS